ncbi:MAG: HD domain-containing protein [Actinobacteria bacterium]|nr:MAG: HD domain-containing protein [Actinomycetota bacterium]
MVGDLASALAARDPVTAAHSARVTFLAERLAAWLGWDEERLAALGFGARLHDIGKITVSTTILRKRGPLDARELAEIQTHPTAGAKRDIPEGARLLAIVDAFDAMTTTRPYRGALPTSRAATEIERCAGTQFDPFLAHAFLAAWRVGAFTATSAAAF